MSGWPPGHPGCGGSDAPVYKISDGRDGYVSLEVSPDLAFDTQATMDEAVRLYKSVSRDNVMIKPEFRS